MIPRLNPSTARAAILAVFLLLTIIILAIMVWVPELRDNDLFNTIAQAIIIQGLIGLVAAFYFTASERGNDQP